MLEGILTVLVALIAYVYLSDKPETAKWINEKEREFIVERLRKDIGKAQIKSTDINKKQIYATLKDWVCEIKYFFSYPLKYIQKKSFFFF